MRKYTVILFSGLFLLLLFSGCRSTYYEPLPLPQYEELNDKDFAKAPCYAISPSKLLPDTSEKAFAYDPDKPALVDVLLKEALEKKGYHTEDFTKCLSVSRLDRLEHVIEVLNIEYACLPVKKGFAVIYRMVVMVRSKGAPDLKNRLEIPHARFFQVYHRKNYAKWNEIPAYFSKNALQGLFDNLLKNRSFRGALRPGGLVNGRPLSVSLNQTRVDVISSGRKLPDAMPEIPDSVFPPETNYPTDAELANRLCGRWRCENFMKMTLHRTGNERRSFAVQGMEEYLFQKGGRYSLIQCLLPAGEKEQPSAVVSSGRWVVRSGSLYLAFVFTDGKIMVLKINPQLQKDGIETLKFQVDIPHYKEQIRRITGENVRVQQKNGRFIVTTAGEGFTHVETSCVERYKRILPKSPGKK